MNKDGTIEEGKFVKGGLNSKPTEGRPNEAPKGQGLSEKKIIILTKE